MSKPRFRHTSHGWFKVIKMVDTVRRKPGAVTYVTDNRLLYVNEFLCGPYQTLAAAYDASARSGHAL